MRRPSKLGCLEGLLLVLGYLATLLMTANATGMEATAATATARKTQPPETGTLVTIPRKTPHAPAPAVTLRTIANPANMVFAASVGFMVLPFLIRVSLCNKNNSIVLRESNPFSNKFKRGRRKISERSGIGTSGFLPTVISRWSMVE